MKAVAAWKHAKGLSIVDEAREQKVLEVERQTRRNSGLYRAMSGTFTRADVAILLPRDGDFIATTNRWLAAQPDAGGVARGLESALAKAAGSSAKR